MTTIQERLAAAGIEVKPLKWTREHPYHIARVFGGHYAVEVWDSGVNLRGSFAGGVFSSLAEAKAAAQADYTDRILAALQVRL